MVMSVGLKLMTSNGNAKRIEAKPLYDDVVKMKANPSHCNAANE